MLLIITLTNHNGFYNYNEQKLKFSGVVVQRSLVPTPARTIIWISQGVLGKETCTIAMCPI